MGKMKKGLIGVLSAIVVIGGLAGCGGSSNSGSKPSSSASTMAKQKSYAAADIDVLIQQAKENAAAAGKNYKKKDLKITGGVISNIDSDLKYLTLKGSDNFSMIQVRCDIDKKNKNLQDSVLKTKKGQEVVVYGNIKDVGDIMGYSMQLDKIEAVK